MDLANDLQLSESREHLRRTRAAVDAEGLGGLLAYADCWRSANVGYFTDFRPLDGISDIAMAAVLLPMDGDPTLFVAAGCVTWAQGVTDFEVAPLAALDERARSWAGGDTGAGLGLAGTAFIPAVVRDRISAALGDVPLVPTDALARTKAQKTPWELEKLRAAAALTDRAMEAIKTELDDGPRTERDLARAADIAMIAGGADATGYRSMVQAGPRSAYSLALPTDRMLQRGDLVMTDIGARYRGYVADGGRGFSYGDLPAERERIVDASVRAVEEGLAAVRPGITAHALNQVIQEALVDAGYEQHSGEARGHGTGHGTGMDPEEELPWIGPGNDTVLAADMVFTLKATITVPDVGGLRTERIVRVTADGCEPLDHFPMRLRFGGEHA